MTSLAMPICRAPRIDFPSILAPNMSTPPCCRKWGPHEKHAQVARGGYGGGDLFSCIVKGYASRCGWDQNFRSSWVTSCPSRPTAQPILACMGLRGHRGGAFSQKQCRSTGMPRGRQPSISHANPSPRKKKILNLSFPGLFPLTPCIFFPSWRKEKLGPVLECSHQALQLWGMVFILFFLPPPPPPRPSPILKFLPMQRSKLPQFTPADQSNPKAASRHKCMH